MNAISVSVLPSRDDAARCHAFQLPRCSTFRPPLTETRLQTARHESNRQADQRIALASPVCRSIAQAKPVPMFQLNGSGFRGPAPCANPVLYVEQSLIHVRAFHK